MSIKQSIELAGKVIDLSRPAVMAIINITPDSFFSSSRLSSVEEIKTRVADAVSRGADILDVGGYSSRPGAADVSPREEYERVISAVRIIREYAPEIPVSIDTFRASVAEKVINEAGPCIVNDISAGELDPEMMKTVGALGVPYIAMHMRGNPRNMQEMNAYSDITAEIKQYFKMKIDLAHAAGIRDIILDPGFGFSKNTDQNYEVLAHMSEFGEFGLPVLAGISRKSMIWRTLDITPAEALCGTTALNWECLRQGASILRVHDVGEAVQVVKLFEKFRGLLKIQNTRLATELKAELPKGNEHFREGA